MTLRAVVDYRYDFLLPVLNKMQAQALCRFRQTNRQMDKFVERNRHKITAVHNVEAFIQEHFICGQYHTLVMTITQLDGREGRRDLYDAYKQLSAINFRTIVVKFEQEDSEIDEVMLAATLKKMRLNCETLVVMETYNEDFDDFVRGISATKAATIFGPIVLEDLNKWPIKHLKTQVYLNELDPLSLHLKDCRDILLAPITKFVQEEIVDWVSQFLAEIRENRNARGSLEHLAITYGKGSLVEKFPGVRDIYRGYFLNIIPLQYYICCDIQKLEIDGGLALIIRRSLAYAHPDNTHIFFLNSNSRLDLFNAFASYNERYYEQLDLSGRKDGFLNAKDDETAFALLFTP